MSIEWYIDPEGNEIKYHACVNGMNFVIQRDYDDCNGAYGVSNDYGKMGRWYETVDEAKGFVSKGFEKANAELQKPDADVIPEGWTLFFDLDSKRWFKITGKKDKSVVWKPGINGGYWGYNNDYGGYYGRFNTLAKAVDACDNGDPMDIYDCNFTNEGEVK